MTEDFYDLLEVPPDASQSEIKTAFREKVRVYHPDLNDDDRAQAQFTALKKAYDILGDPTERKAYDRLGHEDYIAKRTSGLPSQAVWSDDTEPRTQASTTTTSSGQATKSRASAGGSSSTSTAANGGTATAQSSYGSYQHEESGLERVVNWWHRRNFAWPLIYASTLAYVGGLAHYGLENGSALSDLQAELEAIGADPGTLWAALGESRHGLPTAAEYLDGVEPVTPPLEGSAWLAALAGIVVLSLVIVLAARLAWRRDTWGPITLDETIVVALALAVAGTLYGGPLAAGALLMPLLFGVIVHRTRQLPGWSPSYLWVLLVALPLVGLAVLEAGYASLQWEFAVFGLLPVLGAIGLPIRVQIRKRLGR